MIIDNASYSDVEFSENDLYIFAIGYEHRSYNMHKLVSSKLSSLTSVIFAFDDYKEYEHTRCIVEELKNDNINIIEVAYLDSQRVHQTIIETIKNMMAYNDSVTVHIDYSSMPRSWYCKLPSLLKDVLRSGDKIFFWYSEGEYPASYEEYPSAGINAFTFFAGKPTLQIDKSGSHILALGFDSIRTEAIISITDPNYLIACYAFNPDRDNFQENIKKANHQILPRVAMSLALRLDDFSFMVSKLRETVNELLPLGDVVLIPDGPKPLIFAMSLIPGLIKKNGITCLHVARNNTDYKAVDVTPTGVIYGFSIQVE